MIRPKGDSLNWRSLLKWLEIVAEFLVYVVKAMPAADPAKHAEMIAKAESLKGGI